MNENNLPQSGGRLASPSGKKVSRYLIAIATLVCVLIYSIRFDPLAKRNLQLSFVGRSIASARPATETGQITTEGDPKIGTPIENVSSELASALSGKSAGGKSHLVIFIGSCGTCVAIPYAAIYEKCSRVDMELVLVTSSSDKEAKEFLQKLDFPVQVIVDNKIAIAKSLHVI